MHKFFYLPKSFDLEKGKPAIDDLNKLLGDIGVQFNIVHSEKSKKLSITVDETKLKNVIIPKAGRPTLYNLDFDLIFEMKKSGKTDKEIYTELGISKSLYYLRMKEYKNNIGH